MTEPTRTTGGCCPRCRSYLIYLVPAVLLILWIQAEVRAGLLRREMGQLKPVSISLQAVDADTKDPLDISIQAPTPHGRWPKAFSTSATDGRRVRLSWIGIRPIEVGVSAEGYAQQFIKLDEHSPSSVLVPLKKPE